MSDIIYSLTHSNLPMTKVWKKDGTVKPSVNGKYFHVAEHKIDNINELSTFLTTMEGKHNSFIVRGKYKGDAHAKIFDPDSPPAQTRRTLDTFQDQPLHALMIDVDRFEPLFENPIINPKSCIEEYIKDKLPECFHDATYHYQLSANAGKKGNENILKAHIWFWLKNPYTSHELKEWVNTSGIDCDSALFNPIQIHFTSNPVFEDGVSDPIKKRSSLVQKASDEVDLVIDELRNHTQHKSSKITYDSVTVPDLIIKMKDMLPYISSEDRDAWIKVGMAIHYETGASSEGFELYHDWSENASSYKDRNDVKRTWNSFKSNTTTPVAIGTIRKLVPRFI